MTPEMLAKLNGLDIDYLSDGSPIFTLSDGYKFTSDSILLANKVQPDRNDTVVDFCAGSGIVGFEIAAKNDFNKLKLVEIDHAQCDVILQSKRFKKFKTEVEVVNSKIQELENLITKNSVDIVVCNPPFFKVGAGKMNKNPKIAIARHEIELTLKEIFISAKRILKNEGKFFLLHIKSRDKEIEKLCKSHNFKIADKQELDGKLKRVIYTLINKE